MGIDVDIDLGAVRFHAPVTHGGSGVAGSIIRQSFDGPVAGTATLLLPERSGLGLARLIVHSASSVTNLDVELRGVLLEVGDIVLNGVLGSLSTCWQQSLQYTAPELTTTNDAGDDRWRPEQESLRKPSCSFMSANW